MQRGGSEEEKEYPRPGRNKKSKRERPTVVGSSCPDAGTSRGLRDERQGLGRGKKDLKRTSCGKNILAASEHNTIRVPCIAKGGLKRRGGGFRSSSIACRVFHAGVGVTSMEWRTLDDASNNLTRMNRTKVHWRAPGFSYQKSFE